MLFDKVSTKQKLIFIPKPIEQICVIHLAPAIYFCAKNTCQLYSYLCDRCRRENTHNHVDEIYEYGPWVEKMTEKIGKLKVINNRIFQSVYEDTSKNDFRRYVGELRRVLEIVENLELKLNEMIRETKLKIIGNIRKYETFGESKLSSKGYLYANPYIFVNKINSQRNDEFVQDLKKCFNGDTAELIDGFNPKYQVINLQARLKKLLEGNNSELFNLNKEIVKAPMIQSYQKTVIFCDSKPQKAFMKGDTLLVGLKNETQIYRLSNSTNVEERLAITLSKYSSIIVQSVNNFIGINRENNRDLITCINKKLGSFTFQFKIYSILLYYHNNKYYSIIGRDEGKITIFDIQSSLILATLQEGHNSKVEFLQPWENEMKILSCGKGTAISIYKVSHHSDEVSLQYQQQMKLEMGEIKQFQIYGTFFVALFQGKNVLVHDLMLKVQYKSISSQVCKDFDLISLLVDSQTHLIFSTHNEGDNHLCVWFIQKRKPEQVKCERLLFFEREESIIVQLSGNEVWLIRPQENERKLYNFNLQVV